MSDFDERSGIVACETEWGRWWQTIDDVVCEIQVPQGTRGKEVQCHIKTNSLKVVVRGDTIIEGKFPMSVHGEDSLWTIEDNKLLRIVLLKTDKTAENVWKSLLVGQYEADTPLYDKMEQNVTLQRFQLETPGMDFSSANITGNYHGGGPKLPS